MRLLLTRLVPALVCAVFVGAFAAGELYADTRYIAADTISYSFADPITMLNSETMSNTTDGTITFSRDDAGVVTLTCADDDATAALTILPGGAAAMILGGASMTSLTVTTDGAGTGEVVLPLQSIAGAEMVNDTVDGAQLADTIDLDATLAITVAAAEAVTINKTATDATSENGLVVNYTALDTTSGTTAQYATYLNNVASTEAADGLLVLDNSDADDNVAAAVLVLNPTRFTSHLSTGTAGITIGAAATTAITLTTDGDGTGEVVLSAGAIDLAELTYAGRADFTICGDATTVNNNTVYYGPSATFAANYGRACDITAVGNVTEATADDPPFGLEQITAAQVASMDCLLNDPGATVTLTLRSNAAATTPSVTCSIADNEYGCVADVQTTTAISLANTVSIAAASSADMGAAQFFCTVHVVF